MRYPRKRGSTSNMVRIFIPDNSVTTGAGCTGLTSASTNLTIAYIRSLDNAATTYTGANIEAQTTIGTYGAPSTSSKIKFKPVDATNLPGVYELQIHDSATVFGTGDTSDSVIISIYEATTTALKIGPNMVLIPLVPWDYQDGVRMGLTALPNAAAAASGGLPTIGVTIPNATAGATGGLFIAGTNAATTVTTSFTTTFTGNLSGSVNSVATGVGLAASQHVIVDSGTVTTLTNLPSIPANWLTSAGVDSTAITAIQSGLATPTNITAATGVALAASQHVIVDSGTVTTLSNLPAITAGWLTATGIASSALNSKGDWNTTTPPAASTIAGAVFDVVLSSHLTAGTTGFALNAAGSAGDPWGTNLPGAYGSGTAGYIVGHNLDAAVSTRSTYAGGAVASVTAGVTLASSQHVIVDSGTVTSVTNPVTAGTVSDKSGYSLSTTPPTGAQVAALVLATPANKLATDSAGRAAVSIPGI